MLKLAAFAGAQALVPITLLLVFISWDVLYFQPQRPQIVQLIASATGEERNPPETIVRLVRAQAPTYRGLAPWTHYTLAFDPTNPTSYTHPTTFTLTHWAASQLRALLWSIGVWLHLSEQEQMALIVSRSDMGQGTRGFSATSQALFGRPLASLSLDEAATLVLMPRSANLLYRRPKEFAERRDWFLARLKAAP